MSRLFTLLMICQASFLLFPKPVSGEGCLYPTAGYMFYLGGDAEELDGAPAYGVRLEYNYSSRDVFAVGLVYSYSRHDFQHLPSRFHVDQHFCLLGYRLGKNWEWVNFGSQLGMGAVVSDFKGGTEGETTAGYAFQFGLTLSFRPLPWLHVGPDASFLITSDADQWIFGGRSSYFFNLGAHAAVYF